MTATKHPAIDTDQVLALLAAMRRHDLSELEVRATGAALSLRIAGGGSFAAPAPASPPPPSHLATRTVTSPLAGKVARALAAGTPVADGAVLCLITTADGRASELEAEHAGRVSAAHVTDGATVAVGAPMFDLTVERSERP